MTTTEHRRLGSATAVLLVLGGLLCACGSDSGATEPRPTPGSSVNGSTGAAGGSGASGTRDGGEPADPVSEVPRPRADFDADLVVTAGSVRVRYTLTNRTDDELLVPDRPPQGDAYVTGDLSGDGSGIVVSRRVFAQPDTDRMDWAQAPEVGATRVAAGATLRGEVEVPRPFVRAQPYGDDLGYGTIELPEAPTEVRFCLGVLPAPYPAQIAEQRSAAHPVVDHGLGNASGQYVFCSEPVRLTGGSSS